jgi:hypothetical protein
MGEAPCQFLGAEVRVEGFGIRVLNLFFNFLYLLWPCWWDVIVVWGELLQENVGFLHWVSCLFTFLVVEGGIDD